VLKNASAAMSAGRVDEAKRLLKDAGDRFGSVQALLLLARVQSTQGDLAGALDSVRAARRLAPNSEEVLLAYAQVSLAGRLPVPAILALESLTRLCPTVSQYHYLLGVALVRAGDMPAASDALVRAQALDADRPLTLIALGLVYTQQKALRRSEDRAGAQPRARPRQPRRAGRRWPRPRPDLTMWHRPNATRRVSWPQRRPTPAPIW